MADFNTLYETYSNMDLLQIISNPHKYQQEAVEAASAVFYSRNLTDAEIELYRIQLENSKIEEENVRKKKQAFQNKIKASVTAIAETLHPIYTEKPSVQKLINYTSLIFAIFSIVTIYSQANMIWYILTEDNISWDYSVITVLFSVIIPPLATLLFYRRLKAGWTLLFTFLAYYVANILYFAYWLLTYNQESYIALDISPDSHLSSFLMLFFYGGFTWVLCKKSIRQVYNITLSHILFTTFITLALTYISLKIIMAS